MTTPLDVQFQADFETASHGVRLASTSLRPDAVSLDYREHWCRGPATIGDPVSEGPESRLWRARILTEGEILLVRSTLARDAWIASEEVAICSYPPSYPVRSLKIGFTVWGALVIATQRNTGPGGDPEIWLASTNPNY